MAKKFTHLILPRFCKISVFVRVLTYGTYIPTFNPAVLTEIAMSPPDGYLLPSVISPCDTFAR